MNRKTGYLTKHTLRNLELIKEAIATKNIILNDIGDIVPSKTLRHIGVIPTKTTIKLIKEHAQEAGYRVFGWYIAETAGERVFGMPYGPKTKDLPVEMLQLPSVYEIVCSVNGKRYVGSSKRPDLRRAVHLYWLRHIEKDGTSNIFGRNPSIVEDIKKYGPNAFYIEIVEQLPNASRKELHAAEMEYMATIKDKLYNIDVPHRRAGRRRIRYSNPRYFISREIWANAIRHRNAIIEEIRQKGKKSNYDKLRIRAATAILSVANKLRKKEPRWFIQE